MEQERPKSYWNAIKLNRYNSIFQKKDRKFYLQVGGKYKKTYLQPDAKEAKQILSKILGRRNHNGREEWINDMGKSCKDCKKTPKANTHLDSLRATLKLC